MLSGEAALALVVCVAFWTHAHPYVALGIGIAAFLLDVWANGDTE